LAAAKKNKKAIKSYESTNSNECQEIEGRQFGL
jgi:hypothetical protein